MLGEQNDQLLNFHVLFRMKKKRKLPKLGGGVEDGLRLFCVGKKKTFFFLSKPKEVNRREKIEEVIKTK